MSLERLLRRRSSLRAALAPVLDAWGGDVGLQGLDGRWLIEARRGDGGETARVPIVLQDQQVGWVAGRARPEQLTAIAGLVGYVADQEAEKRSLAAEVLERYRELSLLYTLAAKVAASPEPAAMAAIALSEAGRLIPAGTGMVLSVCGDFLCDEMMAATGSTAGLRPAPEIATDLLRRVLSSGQPEVENSVPRETVFESGEGHLSLLCAPLKTEQRLLGALLLVRDAPEPFTAGDLKLLNSVALQVAPALEITRLHQMAVEKARMERELQMARQVQASLIPSSLPEVPGWDLACDWRPALEVSGDYFDLVPGDDGQLSLVIADVSGKGMPASLFMVFTRSVLRASMEQRGLPAEALAWANRLITQEARSNVFVTLFYGRLNMQTGDLTYVNAGHNPPLLRRSATGEILPLTRTGMALGVLEEMPYEQATVRLQPGDMLLMYTDGLTEAFNAAQEEFGVARLRQVVHEQHACPAGDLVAALESAVDDFTRGAPASDDTTLLALKRL